MGGVHAQAQTYWEAEAPSYQEPQQGGPLAGENVMNVIVVGAECAPWSKTGRAASLGSSCQIWSLCEEHDAAWLALHNPSLRCRRTGRCDGSSTKGSGAEGAQVLPVTSLNSRSLQDVHVCRQRW